MPHFEGDLRAAPDARFAIIASRWNPRITDTLVAAARELASAGRHAAIVALGCVVRGDTRHYEQVADGASDGLMQVALETGVPVANGVLAVERFEDAQARAGGSHGNKGEEAALVVIEMADLQRKLKESAR